MREKLHPFLSLSPYLYFYRSAILYSNSRAKFEYNERLIKTMGLGCIVVDNEWKILKIQKVRHKRFKFTL